MGNYISTFHWEPTGEEHYISDRIDRIGEKYLIFETRPREYLPDQANFAYGIEGLNRLINLRPETNLINFSNEVVAAFPQVKISYQITYHPSKYLFSSLYDQRILLNKEVIPTNNTNVPSPPLTDSSIQPPMAESLE